MEICKICLKENNKDSKFESYHDKCFRSVFETLKVKDQLPFTRKEFKTKKAREKSSRFSISGMQPKLSLKVYETHLETVETNGTHIIKLSPEEYPECSENEHLSMEIFRLMGIRTAECALMKLKEGENAYVTKRFDRYKNPTYTKTNGEDEYVKIHQEDMMQAMGISNEGEGKYDAKTYQQVGEYIFSIFGTIEALEFLKTVILNFCIGNDDYHLKNISIQSEKNRLTPSYDIVNTLLYAKSDRELGLYLLNDKDGDSEFSKDFEGKEGGKGYGFYTYSCFNELGKRIGLPSLKLVDKFYNDLKNKRSTITQMIQSSYLNEEHKEKYLEVFNMRMDKLFKPDS
ncbi:HipA domain-containing protein [Bacteriovoracaceae bacterium]|nr:HipA domain-containing protein [Bacteriovoracaceae bacterium]